MLKVYLLTLEIIVSEAYLQGSSVLKTFFPPSTGTVYQAGVLLPTASQLYHSRNAKLVLISNVIFPFLEGKDNQWKPKPSAIHIAKRRDTTVIKTE